MIFSKQIFTSRLTHITTLVLFLFYFVPSQTALSAKTKSGCLTQIARDLNKGKKAVSQATNSSSLTHAKHDGVFEIAQDEHLETITKQFLEDQKHGFQIQIEGQVHRVTQEHLTADFASLSERKLKQLRQEGIKKLRKAPRTQHQKMLVSKISPHGYDSFSRLHYFTSGAGLWSRGGGQVKTLIPLNISELVSKTDLETLITAGEIVSASSAEKALKAAGLEHTNMSHADVVKLTDNAKKVIDEIIKKAQRNKKALNIMDLKFADLAVLSKKSKSYIHFDIWTSEQTHEAIASYIKHLKKNLLKKTFHPDPKINRQIQEAMNDYFLAGEKLGETHLFGYQKGVYALDPHTGKPILGTVPIGEGAGMAKTYMDETGRTAELTSRGVENWVFQNIEVTSDIPLEYATHLRSKKPVSVTLVRTQKGYSGGSPYRITNGDKTSFQLLEGSAVSDELAKGNEYFNTNTIYHDINLDSANDIVGYEKKENGRIVRVKQNAGDVTIKYDTALTGGRIGHEYENFKNYGEYVRNGPRQISLINERWTDLP